MRIQSWTEWLLAVITAILLIFLISILPGCGSVRKSQRSVVVKVDSSHVVKVDSFSVVKKDHVELSKDSGYSHTTVVVEFDTTHNSTDTGHSTGSTVITFKSDSIMTINLGTNKPKKITIREVIKKNKVDSFVRHYIDSGGVNKIDTTNHSITIVAKEKDKVKKEEVKWWVWFLVLLVLAAVVYRWRWKILEWFKV